MNRQFSRLLEWTQEPEEIVDKLRNSYESLGYYVQIEGDDSSAAINVSGDPDFDYVYTSDKTTGLFFYFYPIEIDKELKYKVHINTIVIEHNKRGAGLAGKFLEIIVNTFKDDLYCIELNDLSESTFWTYMQKKYDHIKWEIDED